MRGCGIVKVFGLDARITVEQDIQIQRAWVFLAGIFSSIYYLFDSSSGNKYAG